MNLDIKSNVSSVAHESQFVQSQETAQFSRLSPCVEPRWDIRRVVPTEDFWPSFGR